MYEASHWDEITDNIRRYLAEDVCVPGAKTTVSVPITLIKNLNGIVAAIAEARFVDETNATLCLQSLTNLSMRIASILAEINKISGGKADTTAVTQSDISNGSLDLEAAGSSTDPFINTAKIIVQGLHRAFFELAESNRSGDNVYVFHHLALVYDLFSELNRLSCDAISHISTERLLSKEHPHMQLLERRWQEDGI
ncbi:MAG: hypothetical protein ABI865_09850 [Nitrosospira sp.]